MDRLYLPAELGGLGIFDIKTFFQAQHCSWIARAVKMPIDNWRFDLRAAAPGGNLLHIRPFDIDQTVNPILHNICVSFENFYGEYCKKMEIIKRPIFFLIRLLPGDRIRC